MGTVTHRPDRSGADHLPDWSGGLCTTPEPAVQAVFDRRGSHRGDHPVHPGGLATPGWCRRSSATKTTSQPSSPIPFPQGVILTAIVIGFSVEALGTGAAPPYGPGSIHCCAPTTSIVRSRDHDSRQPDSWMAAASSHRGFSGRTAAQAGAWVAVGDAHPEPGGHRLFSGAPGLPAATHHQCEPGRHPAARDSATALCAAECAGAAGHRFAGQPATPPSPARGVAAGAAWSPQLDLSRSRSGQHLRGD